QVGVFMGYVSRHDHALLDFRLSLPEEWARDAQRRQQCHVPLEVRYQTRQEQCLEMLDTWRDQVPHGWVTGDGVGHMTVDTCGKPDLPSLLAWNEAWYEAALKLWRV